MTSIYFHDKDFELRNQSIRGSSFDVEVNSDLSPASVKFVAPSHGHLWRKTGVLRPHQQTVHS